MKPLSPTLIVLECVQVQGAIFARKISHRPCLMVEVFNTCTTKYQPSPTWLTAACKREKTNEKEWNWSRWTMKEISKVICHIIYNIWLPGNLHSILCINELKKQQPELLCCGCWGRGCLRWRCVSLCRCWGWLSLSRWGWSSLSLLVMIIIVTAGDDHHCQVGDDHLCHCWWWLSLSSWGRSMIIIVTAGEDHHCQVGGDRQVGCRQFQHWRWQWGNIFAFSHLVPLFLKLLRALPLSGTVKPELLVISILGQETDIVIPILGQTNVEIPI